MNLKLKAMPIEHLFIACSTLQVDIIACLQVVYWQRDLFLIIKQPKKQRQIFARLLYFTQIVLKLGVQFFSLSLLLFDSRFWVLSSNPTL